MAPTVLTPAKPEVPARTDDLGPGGGSNGGHRFGDDGSGGYGGHAWSVPARAYRTGMWMALAAIVMLFAAFTSALVVRKGISNDWVRTALPNILWLNTAVLLLSSLTFELARRAFDAGGDLWVVRGTRWLYLTLGLGVAFIAGQLVAWRELAARGVYLATNPSSSFFYLLTAAHGIHLLGGIVALGYAAIIVRKIAAEPRKRIVVDLTALYWHFMDGLWVYLLILLTVRL
ncbi:MAG TPA: cytochrome c oxidase subunit 3 [Terriglobia bacterium]|nr:cytochrome c oxidase subunit 3 [Terriglobia bacterium]